MPSKRLHQYNIRQKAKNVSETPWLEVSDKSVRARRLVKFHLIRDASNSDKIIGVHLDVAYQKRNSSKQEWPKKFVDIRNVRKDFGFRTCLDTKETKELYEALGDVYKILEEDIGAGERTVISGSVSGQHIVVTDRNAATILEKIIPFLNEGNIKNLSEERLKKLPLSIAYSRIYEERKKAVESFENNLNQNIGSEADWQRFLDKNTWIFGNGYIGQIGEKRISIKSILDHPLITEDGYLEIVEIKKPTFPFWSNSLYRDKYYVPYSELQKAIVQANNYIFEMEKQVDSAEFAKTHNGIFPVKPKCLVVHGRSNEWKKSQHEAFRILNDSLHGVKVITFDHLLTRAKQTLSTFSEEDKK